MAKNVIHQVNPRAAEQVQTAKLFTNPLALAEYLVELEGHQFLPEDSLKMVKYHRSYPKNSSSPVANPFIGSGLHKVQNCQATVTFDYQKKREKRGGEEPEYRGTWHTVVMSNCKVSPLSVHKSDVVTELPKDKEDKIANYRAVLDAEGNVQFTTDEPRLYLRYEIVRDHGEDDRQNRQMRLESRYLLPGKQHVRLITPDRAYHWQGPCEVERASLEPFLPKRQPRKDETDMQVLSLAHVIELRAGGKVFRKDRNRK